VHDRLVARIEAEGPLPFDEFMRAALYDPDGGFFGSGSLRSEMAGDFMTSPEVSPMFGETLAAHVSGEADRIGIDAPDLIEAGAGSGSLLRPLLDTLNGVGGVWVVERSPAAKARLAERVPEAVVVGELGEVPPQRRGVVLANELLDNLPAALVIRRDEAWVEQRVGTASGVLRMVEVPARPEVAAWADAHAGDVAEGNRVEVQIEVGEWVTAALGLLDAGSLVAIDYGDTAEGLRPRRAEGTLRTYREHHLGPDPLLEPGATDITMDVNFSAVAAAAAAAGAEVTLQRQEEFLDGLGLGARLSALRHEELELARRGDTMGRLRARSRVSDGRTLLHPRGLGDFRVLVARVG
jgi:SAM-dependent MidA family methyltransferase